MMILVMMLTPSITKVYFVTDCENDNRRKTLNRGEGSKERPKAISKSMNRKL